MAQNKNKSRYNRLKPKCFNDIYEQMLADESKSFWDLSPVHNTLIGRTISHIMFRTVGVGMSNYFKQKMKTGVAIPTLKENRGMVDLAETEFLSAWNNVSHSFDSLLLESLSFNALIDNRDYQLWLVQSLARISTAQWDKQRDRFIHCGNPLYIVAYNVWKDFMRGCTAENYLGSLPTSMSLIEKYTLTRTVRGYELDEELTELVAKLKTGSKQHGYAVVEHTHTRVDRLFSSKSPNAKREKLEISLTDTGRDYYEHSGVLWGLWAASIPTVMYENETLEEALPSLGNALVNGYSQEVYGRLRASFLSEWTYKNRNAKDEAEEEANLLADASKEIEKLARNLSQATSKLIEADKDIKKHKENYASLELAKDSLVKRNAELEAKLRATEKKLAAAMVVTKVVPETPETLLEKKVATLDCALRTANNRIDDLFMLFSASDEEVIEDTFDSVDNIGDVFDVAARNFNGRVILNGGAKTWQDRVRKWLEEHDIKVRTYDLGETITGLRASDVVLMNVIQNKHKYSVKFMNEVRSMGVRLNICNVNNVEQTLKIVFDQPDAKLC